MPAVTYQDFGGGLDRRLSVNSQDANKLWTLKNASVTLAKRLKKRPGLFHLSGGLTGSFGLKYANNDLNVFCDTGTVFAPPSGVTRVNLDIPATGSGSGSTLDRVYSADLFQGYLYVVARYANEELRHHYVNGKSSTVGITNASPGVVTWTAHGLLADDAVVFTTDGSLPTGLTAGTVYYVRNAAADTFEVSATSGGASINTSSAGAGVHTVTLQSYVMDGNCPQSAGITKAASRIFAPSEEDVRYCAAGSARDWTTASDAGFLAAALQQDAARTFVQSVGTFQDALVVFFQDSAQLWNVYEDPTANVLSKRMYGIGTSEACSTASFFNDLVFLSPFGFRSMTVQAQTDRIDDNDVGVPIDSLVRVDVAATAALSDPQKVQGIWLPQFGQYWAVFDMGTYSKAWVYTFSRTSKLACWSEYVFPIKILGITQALENVYLRSADDLYLLGELQFTDNGAPIDVEIQMAFQDAKQPGVSKQFYAADLVAGGEIDLSFLFDPRDASLETGALTVSQDTRPGDLLPVDVVAPAIAPVFRHSADEAMNVDALTLYFHSLGAL